MRIIEDLECLEYIIDETTFYYRRLRVLDQETLLVRFQDRGTIDLHSYWRATLHQCVRGWDKLEGLGGRQVLSPALNDDSIESKNIRCYIVDCLPYEYLREFSAAVTRPGVTEIIKNLPRQLNGNDSLPIPVVDDATPALTAAVSVLTPENLPHVTPEG